MYTFYPDYIYEDKIDETKLLSLLSEDRIKLGQVLFQHHCNDCNSDTVGYIAVAHLTTGWTPDIIRTVVSNPEKTNFFIPPCLGTKEEAKLLVDYIISMQRQFPADMYYGSNDN